MAAEEDVDVLLDVSYRVHCEDWDYLDFIDEVAVEILVVCDECTEPVVVGHILAQYVDLGRWLNAGTPVSALGIFDAHSEELAALAPHVVDEDGELIPEVVGGFSDVLYVSHVEIDEPWRNRRVGTRALAYLIKTVGRGAGIVVVKPWPSGLKRDSDGVILLSEESRLSSGIARLTEYYGRMGFETLGNGPYLYLDPAVRQTAFEDRDGI